MGKSAKKKARRKPALLARLRAHFGDDPSQLPIVEQSFALYHRPNIHPAIEEMLTAARAAALDGTALAARASRHRLVTAATPATRLRLLDEAVKADAAPAPAAATKGRLEPSLFPSSLEGETISPNG